MKVVLLANVPKLGKADEIKEVSDGYARNYLFARNLAIPASGSAMKDIEAREEKKKQRAEADLQKEQATAAKLDGYELELREKANKGGGSLYAAINAQVVAAALVKKGFVIDKSQIRMDPIKELGEYDIDIVFSHGLEAEIRLVVLAK